MPRKHARRLRFRPVSASLLSQMLNKPRLIGVIAEWRWERDALSAGGPKVCVPCSKTGRETPGPFSHRVMRTTDDTDEPPSYFCAEHAAEAGCPMVDHEPPYSSHVEEMAARVKDFETAARDFRVRLAVSGLRGWQPAAAASSQDGTIVMFAMQRIVKEQSLRAN